MDGNNVAGESSGEVFVIYCVLMLICVQYCEGVMVGIVVSK